MGIFVNTQYDCFFAQYDQALLGGTAIQASFCQSGLPA